MSDESTLRTVPIHRALNRPNLVMGCDREMVMFIGLISAVLIIGVFEWKAALFGLCLWMFGLFLLRRMAKADPKMRHVYLRNKTYKDHYAPRPTPFRVIRDALNNRRMANPWKR